VISLVGYTNAGKSTLLNTLTKSDIHAEDLLFATLDPTSRRLRFPQDMEVIITDTVGFIRHLPADLLKAFESTLEELFEADLLLHVIDVSNPAWRRQVEVVESLLTELELDAIPCLKVFNKLDLVDPEVYGQLPGTEEGVVVSALRAETLPALLTRAWTMLRESVDQRNEQKNGTRNTVPAKRAEARRKSGLQEKSQGFFHGDIVFELTADTILLD
jgi:GTPase